MSDVSLATPDAESLTYPLGRIPAPGEVIEVGPGVLWVRLPIPFQLDHINVWLIEDTDGWFIVDTGVATDDAKALWRKVFATHLMDKPIKGVIVTHLHPDHVGLAGWLTRKWNVDLHMSRIDFLSCRNLVLDTGREAPKEALAFYRAAGFSERGLDDYAQRFGNFGERVSRLPDTYRRLREGDEMKIGDHIWRVVVGSGHAPEHVCLYCADLKLFISGDQVLPRISSNVSVHPTDLSDNPLQEWIESCHRLRANLPADLLVLPAHNEPFMGLHLRLTSLIDGHESSLAKLHDYLSEPRRAIDVFPALFKRKIVPDVFFLATGESLAHLRCLIGRGLASVRRDDMGVDWYSRIG
ncbi:MAG: MBL fold metallo-hydrolase [Parvibaculum sp.]